MPLDRNDKLLLFALLALNAALKLSWLGVNDLAGDEPFTVYWSQRSLHDLFGMLREENNPPLYFLIMKAWSAIVPFEAAWLRVPSAVFSVLAVWPLFALAQRIGSRSIAIVTVLLFTFTGHHYQFAHEVRAYSLFTLLAIASLQFLRGINDAPDRRLRKIILLAAVNTLLVYTHFFGWLMIGIQLLCVVLVSGWRPLRRNFLIALGMTVLCYLPYASIFFSRMGHSVSQGTWLGAPAWDEPYSMIWRWSNQPVIAVCFAAVIAIALWRTRARDVAMRIGVIWALVPLLGMYLISFAVPIYADRYLVWAAPGFALLVSASLFRLSDDPRLGNWLAAAACAGMLFTFAPWKPGVRQPSRVVAVVDEWCAVDCAVEIVPRWYWLNYLAAQDLDQLKEDNSDVLATGIFVPDAADIEDAGPTIVVDASGDPTSTDRDWFRSLRAAYPAVDSADADHRVRVYRFRR